MTGSIRPSNGKPGLVVRDTGFSLGEAQLKYGGQPVNPNAPPPTDPNALVATRPVGLDGILEFVDLRIGIKDFSIDFSKGAQPFSGTIFFASGGAKFFPGKPINATITDRLTADDRNPDGTLNDEALRLELTFTARQGRRLQVQGRHARDQHLGSFVTLTARDFMLNTGAAANQELVCFGVVGAKVKIGTLELGGEAATSPSSATARSRPRPASASS